MALACLPASAGVAQSGKPSASLSAERPVFIVTSRTTQALIGAMTQNAAVRVDSAGRSLVLSESREGLLGVISEIVHQQEKRCGGYFAFSTRAEAETFIRNDRTAQAMTAAAVSYTIDNQATVTPWLAKPSESQIYATINTLQGYKNRYYSSSYGKTAADWIRSSWAGLANGRSDVTTELYTGCGNCGGQPSVVMTVKGNELQNEVVVVGAHLDSTSGGSSNEQLAPGADDDASGVATVTEVIRVALASGWKPKRTVKFMAYAAEEVGLRGSNAIAQSYKQAGVNVVGVLQLDMTNYKSGTPEDMQLVTDYSSTSLKTFFNSLFDTYLKPLGMTRGTITCGYGCSDHASWTSAGYPAGMMFEAGDNAGKNTSAFTGYNPKIHTTGDTLSSMGESAEHSVKFAKFGLAFIGELGKTSGGGGGGQDPDPDPQPDTVSLPTVSTGNWSPSYTLAVAAGKTATISIAGGTGDADLYVRAGAAPTTTTYACRPYKNGNSETCTLKPTVATTYYIKVRAYTTFSGVTLTSSAK